MPAHPQELHHLIDAAQDEAETQAHQARPTSPQQAGANRTLRMGAIAAAGLAFATLQLWPLARPHSADQTEQDLNAIIEQARSIVEAARKAQGRLPDTLPHATLAGLVAYAPTQDGYQLHAALGKVSVTLGTDGQKTVVKGK